jgi:beta-lactamase class A
MLYTKYKYSRFKRKHISSTHVLIYIWCIVACFIFVKKYTSSFSQNIISPVPEIESTVTHINQNNTVKVTFPVQNEFQNLSKFISADLAGAQGTYAIVIQDLTTNTSFRYNEHTVFDTGSLYKLWVMGEIFREIQNNILDENITLSQNIPTLNAKFGLSADVAELNSGTITLSVHNALTQMITISHNYAAMLLTEKIGLSSVTTYLRTNGFSESKVGDDVSNPRTTAYDMAKFFEKLYKNELANPDNTFKMLSLLKQQKLNSKLPKYLPTDITVAHKTGELASFSHDAGIVYGPKGNYIIVILTDSDIPSDAEERISQISKTVYNFFSKK